MKLINTIVLSSLVLVLTISGCAKDPNPPALRNARPILGKAAQDVAEFTSLAPGAPFPQTLREALITDLKETLAAGVKLKSVNSSDVTTEAFKEVEETKIEVSNATMELEEIIVNVSGPAALQDVALISIDETYPQLLLDVERFNNEVFGEI